MSGLVLDASVALSWFFPEEQLESLQTIREVVQEEGALVPRIWPLEVQNALAAGVRRRRVLVSDCREFLALLGELNIRLDSFEESPGDGYLFELAVNHDLSVYDAAYPALALREKLPLATLDRRLADAATSSGVKVFR